ncbi:NAD(P)-dependent oxidoreductase [Tateyamaria sp. ANG-S1]|uniref:NAD(P)-dependent oxidoreductase n=1 Tax=Tateyamaria sp. ANG-S1 TaxID=1577905 RepID=UPI000A6DF853|nr:NAD(P)-dependent oxidoreductase [Tateyamaria sp. ANG-S1]
MMLRPETDTIFADREREIPEQVASIRAGHWQSGVGRTLRGRTLGLYGYGRIAQAVATYAKAIGMNVQWWASDDGRARAQADGETVAPSRNAFFATSDIVSIHVRLKPTTRGIITADDLAAMTPRSLFVNTSRAGLVAPGALEAEVAHFAWQTFDAKVLDLLYGEYHFHDAHYVEADTLDALIPMLDGVDHAQAAQTLNAYNAAVDDGTPFDPTILDGKATQGLPLAKSNWAQRLEQGPFRAYPVTGGITFTYGGLKVDQTGAVLTGTNAPIPGLYACGELVGSVFFNGYPGGSGLTSGAVFGRCAGYGAASI